MVGASAETTFEYLRSFGGSESNAVMKIFLGQDLKDQTIGLLSDMFIQTCFF